MYQQITFKLGKKEYTACVSSWSYEGKNLWLYLYGDDSNCGYIPNGKVISSFIVDMAVMPDESAKIIRAWNVE